MLVDPTATPADMGRLSKSGATGRSSFRVHYRKLVDSGANEYGSSGEALEFVPALPPNYLSYCCHQCGHTQKLQTEELNSIVGNAFRMAYTAQLQKQPSYSIDKDCVNKLLWANKQLPSKETILNNSEIMNSDTNNLRMVPPNTIPGLINHRYNSLGAPSEKTQSQQSTPSSDDCNSPTELNTNKRMAEKPPLIKRLAMGFSTNVRISEDDSCPLVNNEGLNSQPPSPYHRPNSGGFINETAFDEKNNVNMDNERNEDDDSDFEDTNDPKHISLDNPNINPPTPPPLPERGDSLSVKEQGELRIAPWYQAGIPREIVLEILGQEPVGAFLVRESTTKPGCFALSLRVPRTFQATGIAHYLILRVNSRYKIKGFTKEFGTLTSLIVHHSVMQELLPCPLMLSKESIPTYSRSDPSGIFEEVDLDTSYESFADFRKRKGAADPDR